MFLLEAMVARAQKALAMVAAMLLFLQGTAASASALACMKACAEAGKAQVPACHGKQRSAPACQSKVGCDGSCSYVCSPDKDRAVLSPVAAFQLQTIVIVAVIPAGAQPVFTDHTEEPALFVTDSSPPQGHFCASHSLRAPPSLSA
jgi:hypothetical protein